MNKSNLLLALATRSRGYTDKTHLRGLKILDFVLVHGGGQLLETLRERLCSSEFYSPNTFQTALRLQVGDFRFDSRYSGLAQTKKLIPLSQI